MKTIFTSWLKHIQLLLVLILPAANGQAQLQAAFTAATPQGCSPLVVSFRDASTGNPTQWKWDLGNGTISFVQHPSVSYINPGNYTIKLVVKNASSSDSITKTQYITVYDKPAVNFSASSNMGCYPLRTSFTDLSVAPNSSTITQWQWDFGDGFISNQQHPSHIYTTQGSFDVKLKVTTANGCFNVLNKPALVKVTGGVKANFNYTTSGTCQPPTPVNFNNLSTGTSALTYQWSFGDGSTSTAANPVHSYINAGSYTVRLVTINAQGCTDTIVKANAINVGTVQANFALPSLICAGAPIDILNTSVPATVSAVWYFSDGTQSTDIHLTKTFTTAGAYTIKLVNSFGACKDSITKSITVQAKPVAAFTANNNTACAVPATVQFINNSSGGASYFWNFGNGNNSTLQNPAQLFSAQGTYPVSLVITGANGCKDSITKNNFVAIYPPKIDSFKATPKEGCKPVLAKFEPVITSAQPIVSYSWDFGDGTSSSLASPQHLYNAEGSFDITLTITTTGGCSDTYFRYNGVRVGHRPTAKFSADNFDICPSTIVNFTDESTNGPINSWYWDFGDSKTSTLQNPSNLYADTGYLNVMLVAGNNGCRDTLIKPRYIHVNPPIARYIYQANNCNNKLEVVFTDKSIGAVTYNWDFGDGTNSSTPSPVHVFASSGTYIVSLTVTNGSCSRATSKMITVDNRKGKLLTNTNLTCKLDAVNFSVDSLDFNGVNNYQWSFGNGDSYSTQTATTSYRYTQPGNYVASVITSYGNGCIDTLYANANVVVYGPKANFSTLTNSVVCSNTQVAFVDSSVTDGQHNITNWSWSFGDGNSFNSNTSGNANHSYIIGGSMTVILKVTDSYGCVDSLIKPNAVNVAKAIANFSQSDTNICPNYHVTFNNASVGSNLAYHWNFGNGITSNDQSPTITYVNEGAYTVTLYAQDPYGCNDTLIKVNTVKVYRPQAHFVMSDSFAVCPPLLVNMTNNSTNTASSSWYFGDGSAANIAEPSHLYTYPGNYTVKLVAMNNGGCTDSVTRQVKILGPTGTFSYTPTIGCLPLQANFTSITQNTVELIWDFNNGVTQVSNGSTGSYAYTLMGDYIPKMILKDAQGCQVAIPGADTIHVKSITAQLMASQTTVCDSAFVVFTNTSNTNDVITQHKWSFGDGITSNQSQPTHQYAVNGQYNVKLSVQTQAGCKDSITINKMVKVVPKPKIRLTADSSVCKNSALQFGATWLNADTASIVWNWNFGNGNTSNVQNPPAQVYTQAGNAVLQLISTSSNGCADTLTKNVAVRNLPVVNAGADVTICRNQSVTLQATGAGLYNWGMYTTLSCVTCASPVAHPLTDVVYTVTGSNAFGCTATDSILVKVQQPLKLNVIKADTLCLGNTSKIKASGTDTYTWFPTLYIDNPAAAEVNIRPAKDTLMTYRLIGGDNNNCFKDTAIVRVKAYPMPKMEIKQDEIMLNAGSTVQLQTINSKDVTKWKWSPSKWIDNNSIASPTATGRESIVYTCVAANEGNCIARDEVKITVICNNNNVFVPNTFTPNNDGNNDLFYPRGKGVFSIKSLRVFNRWGEIVFERINFQANDATAGWDGTFKGNKLPTDVYVYAMEIQCDNSTIVPTKGNVTLLR
jgi:gliding motility-associated-like protein